MKKYLLFFISIFIAFTSVAENEFFNELMTKEEGKGEVHVFQDSRLVTLMADKARVNKRETNKDYLLLSGYRVQVYSNNTPRTSKNEAYRIENEIKAKMPELGTYISFASPFWKVRVGDCRTYQEAFSLFNTLKTEFPAISNEFYIVKENVRIPLR